MEKVDCETETMVPVSFLDVVKLSLRLDETCALKLYDSTTERKHWKFLTPSQFLT